MVGRKPATPEYLGKQFEVILSDGPFSLVDIDVPWESWIWHLCDEYERHILKGSSYYGDLKIVGLISNSEIIHERCKFCNARIPEGLIATWKMMNWDKMHLLPTLAWNSQAPWGVE